MPVRCGFPEQPLQAGQPHKRMKLTPNDVNALMAEKAEAAG